MMAGKPVICAISAPKTLIEEYQCGLQISSAAPEDIAAAVEQLRRMPAEERDMMGKRGQDAVLAHFTYKQLAEDFLEAVNNEIET